MRAPARKSDGHAAAPQYYARNVTCCYLPRYCFVLFTDRNPHNDDHNRRRFNRYDPTTVLAVGLLPRRRHVTLHNRRPTGKNVPRCDADAPNWSWFSRKWYLRHPHGSPHVSDSRSKAYLPYLYPKLAKLNRFVRLPSTARLAHINGDTCRPAVLTHHHTVRLPHRKVRRKSCLIPPPSDFENLLDVGYLTAAEWL